MAKARQTPEFRPFRTTAPVTAPVQQFYDPSGLAQQADFRKSFEIAEAFSQLSSSLSGFAKTYTASEIKKGEQEFVQYAKSPQKLKEKVTELIEASGRIAPWRARAFLTMYGGETLGSDYRRQAFSMIDQLSEFVNEDGSIRTDEQVAQELNKVAESLNVPNSFYIQQGFSTARMGIDRELMARVGEKRVSNARQATEDQATREALNIVQNEMDPEKISKSLEKVLNGAYKSGLLTAGGKQAVVSAVLRAVAIEMESDSPNIDRVEDIMSVLEEGSIGNVKLNPELMQAVEQTRNEIDKYTSASAFARDVEGVVVPLEGIVNGSIIEGLVNKSMKDFESIVSAVDSILSQSDDYRRLPSDKQASVRSQLIASAQQTWSQFSRAVPEYDDELTNEITRSLADGTLTEKQVESAREDIPPQVYLEARKRLREIGLDILSEVGREIPLPEVPNKRLLDESDLREVEGRRAAEWSRIESEALVEFTSNPENTALYREGRFAEYRQRYREFLHNRLNENRDSLTQTMQEAVETTRSGLTAVVVDKANGLIQDVVDELIPPPEQLAGPIQEPRSPEDKRVIEAMQKRMLEAVREDVESQLLLAAESEKPQPALVELISEVRLKGLIENVGFEFLQEINEPNQGALIARLTQNLVQGTLPTVNPQNYVETSRLNGVLSALEASPGTPELETAALEYRERAKAEAAENAKLYTTALPEVFFLFNRGGMGLGYSFEGNTTVKISYAGSTLERYPEGAMSYLVRPDGVYKFSLTDPKARKFILPLSPGAFSRLDRDSQRQMVMGALLDQSTNRAVLSKEDTSAYVFNLGYNGFDIEAMTNNDLGGLSVNHGNPYYNPENPTEVSLSQGPPSPAIHLYGTDDDWPVMVEEYQKYQETGEIDPDSLIGRVMDIFDNTITIDSFMQLQTKRREALGRFLEERR
jgi:hypothetical protein